MTLRAVAETDAEAVVALFADPELSRFHPFDLAGPDQARAWVDRGLAYRGPAGTGAWVLDLAGEVAGAGWLRPSPGLPGGVLECGLSLARRHWGRGLADEAVAALLRHAFGTLAVPVVFALVDELDERGLGMTARAGFLDIGSAERHGSPHRILVALPDQAGRLHHVELWVPDLAEAERSWGWLLTELGWTEYQRWPRGVSWRLGPAYLVFEDSPDRRGDTHDRLAPGLNHLALHAGPPRRVEWLVTAGAEHGWRLLYADRHPHAGGPDHYAAYLRNDAGYEVELVATSPRATGTGPPSAVPADGTR